MSDTGSFVCSPPAQDGFPIAGGYGRCVAGDLDGDGEADLATIKGTTLIFYRAPATAGVGFRVDENVLDVCYSPAAGGPGVPGLLYTTASTTEGLKRAVWNGTGLTKSSWGYAEWTNATRIRWVPTLDVSTLPAGPGLIGVKADGRSFIAAAQNGSGFDAPISTFNISPLVRNIELLNWDADAPLELAIHHNNGVHIRGQGGALILARSAVIPGDAIAVVHKADLSDSLAWITRLTVTETYAEPSLILLNSSFATYQGPTVLPQLALGDTVSSLAAADFDGDGDDDLAYTVNSDFGVRVLYNDALEGTWLWGPTSLGAFQEPVGVPAVEGFHDLSQELVTTGSGTAQLVCVPLFNERDPITGVLVPDLALAFQELDGMRVVHTTTNLYALKGRNSSPPPDPHYFEHAGYTPDFGLCAEGSSEWWMTLGNGWGNQQLATHVQVAVRRRIGGVSEPDPYPVEYFYSELSSAGAVAGEEFGFPGGDDTDSPSVVTSATCYYVSVRPVQLDTNLALVSAGAWKVLGLSAHKSSNDPMKHLATARGSFALDNATTGSLTPDDCPYWMQHDVGGWDDCEVPGGGIHVVDGKSVPSAVYQTRVPSLLPPTLPSTAPVYGPPYPPAQ